MCPGPTAIDVEPAGAEVAFLDVVGSDDQVQSLPEAIRPAKLLDPLRMNVDVVYLEGFVIRIQCDSSPQQVDCLRVAASTVQVDRPVVDRGQEVSSGSSAGRIETQCLGVGRHGLGESLLSQQIDAAVVVDRRHQLHVGNFPRFCRGAALAGTQANRLFDQLGLLLGIVHQPEPCRAGSLHVERAVGQDQAAHGMAGYLQTAGTEAESSCQAVEQHRRADAVEPPLVQSHREVGRVELVSAVEDPPVHELEQGPRLVSRRAAHCSGLLKFVGQPGHLHLVAAQCLGVDHAAGHQGGADERVFVPPSIGGVGKEVLFQGRELPFEQPAGGEEEGGGLLPTDAWNK